MIKVIYLTWGETPRSYGLFRSQIIDVVSKIQEEYKESVEIDVLSGLPIIHSGFIREKFAYLKELQTIREQLAKWQISFKTIPIFSSQNFVYPSRFTFPLIFTGWSWGLSKELSNKQPDIVHCRSMLAAYIANRAREKYNFNYKIVYDARSLWPEALELRKPNPKNYSYFKVVEKKLVESVDAIVSVNPEMGRHYEKLGCKHSLVNYLAAHIEHDISEKQNNYIDGHLKVLYLGAIGESTRQDAILLFNIFGRIKELYQNATLTVVTTSSHSKLKQLALQYYRKKMPIEYMAIKNRTELQRTLLKFDLAINAYRKPLNKNDNFFSQTGFATKSSEYLSAGLPIITSKHPKAICSLLNKYKIGLVFDEDKEDGGLSRNAIDSLLNEKTKHLIVKIARDNFDYNVVAKRYVSLYSSLSE